MQRAFDPTHPALPIREIGISAVCCALAHPTEAACANDREIKAVEVLASCAPQVNQPPISHCAVPGEIHNRLHEDFKLRQDSKYRLLPLSFPDDPFSEFLIRVWSSVVHDFDGFQEVFNRIRNLDFPDEAVPAERFQGWYVVFIANAIHRCVNRESAHRCQSGVEFGEGLEHSARQVVGRIISSVQEDEKSSEDLGIIIMDGDALVDAFLSSKLSKCQTTML